MKDRKRSRFYPLLSHRGTVAIESGVGGVRDRRSIAGVIDSPADVSPVVGESRRSRQPLCQKKDENIVILPLRSGQERGLRLILIVNHDDGSPVIMRELCHTPYVNRYPVTSPRKHLTPLKLDLRYLRFFCTKLVIKLEIRFLKG